MISGQRDVFSVDGIQFYEEVSLLLLYFSFCCGQGQCNGKGTILAQDSEEIQAFINSETAGLPLILSESVNQG